MNISLPDKCKEVQFKFKNGKLQLRVMVIQWLGWCAWNFPHDEMAMNISVLMSVYRGDFKIKIFYMSEKCVISI